jgi:hypothetical protein
MAPVLPGISRVAQSTADLPRRKGILRLNRLSRTSASGCLGKFFSGKIFLANLDKRLKSITFSS